MGLRSEMVFNNLVAIRTNVNKHRINVVFKITLNTINEALGTCPLDDNCEPLTAII